MTFVAACLRASAVMAARCDWTREHYLAVDRRGRTDAEMRALIKPRALTADDAVPVTLMGPLHRLEVARCIDCPFVSDPSLVPWCGHPSTDAPIVGRGDPPPDWCPLRTAATVVSIEGGT